MAFASGRSRTQERAEIVAPPAFQLHDRVTIGKRAGGRGILAKPLVGRVGVIVEIRNEPVLAPERLLRVQVPGVEPLWFYEDDLERQTTANGLH